MKAEGYDPSLIHACHNRTVVIDAHFGERENKQLNVVEAHGLRNVHLYEGEPWINVRDAVGDLTKKFLCLNEVYPDGFADSRRFLGENIIHLPTVKTHIFTTMTGAMKNAFGGLLNERRHWTHPVIHETLVDLLMIQKKIHRGVFAVMDGTFAGDGPGPRCMVPYVKNVILASADQVAIDAVAAKLMGLDPLSIKFIRLAHDLGLGVGDPRDIEIVGDPSAAAENWHFDGPFRKMTFASRMQHRIYWGPLKTPMEWSLKTVLAPWAYVASVLYHDSFWYPVLAKRKMHDVLGSEWGRLFRHWEHAKADDRRLPGDSGRGRRDHPHRRAGPWQVDRHPRHVPQGSAGIRAQATTSRGGHRSSSVRRSRRISHPARDGTGTAAELRKGYGRFSRPIRFSGRRADHGADPDAHPREARRGLHRSRVAAPGVRQAREIPRFARRAIDAGRGVS